MSDTAAALICVTCQGAVRAYERNDVTPDHCQKCRSRLVDAEEQRSPTAAFADQSRDDRPVSTRR